MYEQRKKEIEFPTNKICIQGFAREFKSLLLKNEFTIGDSQEYSKVIEAYREILKKKLGTCYPDSALFSEGTFSKWWRGESFPGKENIKLIDETLNGLATKWLSRSKFTSRFQTHLASLDLFFVNSDGSNKAFYEALELIQKITCDWKPDRNNDLCICGPKEREGINHKKFELAKLPSFVKPSKNELEEYNTKLKIKYDLSLGPTSHIGLKIPEPITDIYKVGHDFSIIIFMFCVLCFEKENIANHKLDLLLDLITIINCARFILEKSGVIPFINTGDDKTSEKILSLSFLIDDYFYDDHWSVENQENICKEWKKNSTDELPYIGFLDSPAFSFSEMFEDEIINYFGYSTADVLSSETKENIKNMSIHIFSMFTELRQNYFELFKISGLSEKDVIKKLFKTFRKYKTNTSTIEFGSSRYPKKLSPYS